MIDSDIIPYTKEEMERLGQALAGLHLPCPGPYTGLELLKLAEEIKSLKDRISDPKFDCVLDGLGTRILDVCGVIGSMQGAILAKVERMLAEDRQEEKK